MGMFESIFRKYGARLIAGWVAALAAWLLAHYGVTLDADTQAHFVEATIGMMLAVFGTVYPLLHKYINKHINPGDAATSRLIDVEKKEDDNIKLIGGE